MIKHELVIDKREFNVNDDGSIQPIAYKGHRIKVIEISEMNRTYLNHQFKKETLMTIHEANWKLIDNIIDYCGG
jgi:hypothetical protein